MKPMHLPSAVTTLALFAACAFGASACESPPGGPQNVYTVDAQNQIQVSEGNDQLAAKLEMKDVRSKRLPDGRLMFQFELHNKSGSHTRFAWAVDWFDTAGFKVADAARHWEPVNLGGNGFQTIQITGPTPAANMFRLQVTSPDEVK